MPRTLRSRLEEEVSVGVYGWVLDNMTTTAINSMVIQLFLEAI